MLLCFLVKEYQIPLSLVSNKASFKEAYHLYAKRFFIEIFFEDKNFTRALQVLDAYPRPAGGVSNVDIDGNNTLQIKALGVTISTFETLPFSSSAIGASLFPIRSLEHPYATRQTLNVSASFQGSFGPYFELGFLER
jgi:hypothetical protein